MKNNFNYMKNVFFVLSILVSVSSCKIEGLTNDYDQLKEDQKKKIVALPSFKDQNWDMIYRITGAQLKDELKNHERSMVYIFKNGCTSTYCKPMSNYVDHAKAHNYKLFLVMNGYCNLDQTTDQYPKDQLYSIDNDHYGQKKRMTYIKSFINDMLGKPLTEKEGKFMGNIYFFTRDKLDTIVNELK
jgi:hypothetical protein